MCSRSDYILRMDMNDLNFTHNNHSVDVYGPADDNGFMPFLGWIDLLARVFVPDNHTHRRVSFTDTQLTDQDTVRRMVANAVS
jgi:hypothetical protein